MLRDSIYRYAVRVTVSFPCALVGVPGVYVMRKWKKQVSLSQLSFTDEERLSDCLLYRLAVGCSVGGPGVPAVLGSSASGSAGGDSADDVSDGSELERDRRADSCDAESIGSGGGASGSFDSRRSSLDGAPWAATPASGSVGGGGGDDEVTLKEMLAGDSHTDRSPVDMDLEDARPVAVSATPRVSSLFSGAQASAGPHPSFAKDFDHSSLASKSDDGASTSSGGASAMASIVFKTLRRPPRPRPAAGSVKTQWVARLSDDEEKAKVLGEFSWEPNGVLMRNFEHIVVAGSLQDGYTPHHSHRAELCTAALKVRAARCVRARFAVPTASVCRVNPLFLWVMCVCACVCCRGGWAGQQPAWSGLRHDGVVVLGGRGHEAGHEVGAGVPGMVRCLFWGCLVAAPAWRCGCGRLGQIGQEAVCRWGWYCLGNCCV